MGERQDADHAQAWERYMEAEQRELENRHNGLLRRLLDGPLPGESPEELERLASEDEARAEEGIVELTNSDGQLYYKHLDALSPVDRSDRVAAEGARVNGLLSGRPPEAFPEFSRKPFEAATEFLGRLLLTNPQIEATHPL